MKKSILYIIGLFILSSFLISCGGSSASNSSGEKLNVDLGKKKMRALTASESSGALIFSQMCTSCHQTGGVGKAGMAPSINNPDFLAIASDDVIKKTIMEGRPGTAMMAFKHMPNVADKIDDLVAYIRYFENYYDIIQKVNVDPNLVINGDPKAGEKLFLNYCMQCHGEKGVGYSAGGAGTGIGLKGFLSEVSDDYIKQTIIRGRAGTAMKSFQSAKGLANLDDSEIDNIVSYLRSLQ